MTSSSCLHMSCDAIQLNTSLSAMRRVQASTNRVMETDIADVCPYNARVCLKARWILDRLAQHQLNIKIIPRDMTSRRHHGVYNNCTRKSSLRVFLLLSPLLYIALCLYWPFIYIQSSYWSKWLKNIITNMIKHFMPMKKLMSFIIWRCKLENNHAS